MDEILVAIQDAANTIAAPNWADIMSVCFSLAAVIVACIVAWRQNEISRKQASMADKQNRIALFEKRFEVYEILSSCRSSARIINQVDKDEDVLRYMFNSFTGYQEIYQKFDRNKASLYLMNCSAKLRLADFIFPEEIAYYINEISFKLSTLAYYDPIADGPEKYSEAKQKYLKAIEDFDENRVLRLISEEMKMI